MSKKIMPVCRECRKDGEKLYLKGVRCYSDSCPVEKERNTQRQRKFKKSKLRKSEFYLQLREKQKAKYIYGVMERQFKNYVVKAGKSHDLLGDALLQFLERRLDNVTYRMGFASSRREARQLVQHRHFLINGKIVDIPSYLVRTEDVIQLRDNSKKIKRIKESINLSVQKGIAPWLEININELKGTVLELPQRNKIETDLNTDLIVGFYSR